MSIAADPGLVVLRIRDYVADHIAGLDDAEAAFANIAAAVDAARVEAGYAFAVIRATDHIVSAERLAELERGSHG